MATRIAHISDLHFPAKDAIQIEALRSSIAEMRPDILVVTGDLTRSGKKPEFQEAKEFIASLEIPVLVVPGNHDIPIPGVLARVLSPFTRYQSYFPDFPTYLETPDLVVVGLNTAVGWQPGFDWSLGYVVSRRLQATVNCLLEHRKGRLGIVSCHHPLHQHALDPVRSRTFGGEKAFCALMAAGMGLLLHGHLHRTDCRCFPTETGSVCEVCANTALSNRERGGPAGYNIIEVAEGRWRLATVSWDGTRYQRRDQDEPPAHI